MATVNALLNEVRSHEGLRVPRSDMPFTMDVDVGYDGYGGILCQDKWPVACTSKVWDIAPNEGDEVVPTEMGIVSSRALFAKSFVNCWSGVQM